MTRTRSGRPKRKRGAFAPRSRVRIGEELHLPLFHLAHVDPGGPHLAVLLRSLPVDERAFLKLITLNFGGIIPVNGVLFAVGALDNHHLSGRVDFADCPFQGLPAHLLVAGKSEDGRTQECHHRHQSQNLLHELLLFPVEPRNCVPPETSSPMFDTPTLSNPNTTYETQPLLGSLCSDDAPGAPGQGSGRPS